MNELHDINICDTMFLGKNTTFEANLVYARISNFCGNKLTSTHAISYYCFPLPNFFIHVMVF